MIARSLQHDGIGDERASAWTRRAPSEERWPRAVTAALALVVSLGLWWTLLRAAGVLL